MRAPCVYACCLLLDALLCVAVNLECLPGKYSSLFSQTGSCYECPKGQFQKAVGQSSCIDSARPESMLTLERSHARSAPRVRSTPRSVTTTCATGARRVTSHWPAKLPAPHAQRGNSRPPPGLPAAWPVTLATKVELRRPVRRAAHPHLPVSARSFAPAATTDPQHVLVM